MIPKGAILKNRIYEYITFRGKDFSKVIKFINNLLKNFKSEFSYSRTFDYFIIIVIEQNNIITFMKIMKKETL